jgi:hypothetical protein
LQSSVKERDDGWQQGWVYQGPGEVAVESIGYPELILELARGPPINVNAQYPRRRK